MPKEFEVNEIKGLKSAAEAKILAILKQLEADTYLRVVKVDLTLPRILSDPSEPLADVNIRCIVG
tara:strand:- start:4 stop:198 length:195 start_codon:yes stop_codon:yes gene_type:complete